MSGAQWLVGGARMTAIGRMLPREAGAVNDRFWPNPALRGVTPRCPEVAKTSRRQDAGGPSGCYRPPGGKVQTMGPTCFSSRPGSPGFLP
jgi:hypothetical protein